MVDRTGRIVGTIPALLVTLALCSCGGAEEPGADVQFSSVRGESTSEGVRSENETAGSASASATEEPAEEGSASRTDVSEELKDSDGAYRLTLNEPGPGAAEDVVMRFHDLEDGGFSVLEVEIDTWGQNGFLQYPASDGKNSRDRLRVSWKGWDLGGTTRQTADVAVSLVDGDGRTFSDHGSGEEVAQNTYGSTYLITPEPGDFRMELRIKQPGYDEIVVSQPIVVV